MTRLVAGTVAGTLRALGYGLVGSLVVIVVGFVVYLERRPDLEVWHTAELDAEFTRRSPVTSFEEYLQLEDRLFGQLEERVYDEVGTEGESSINRYFHGSLSDPSRWPTKWNRSFEWTAPEAPAGVLMLHGMSDSPYSMRSLAQRLHQEGAWVLGLRIPGHGTAPSGLVDVEWEDMAAAVRLAMRHLRGQLGDRPLYIVGYSNGGALAVEYALAALGDASLPQPAGLVLISGEIGVTRLAALAVWQERLGHLLGLGKLAWNSILPEYDPYKYQSFALNAGKQAYRLTTAVQSRIAKLGAAGELEKLAPLLAFQSVVDATVSAPALVRGLFDRLPVGTHELVLFDINRFTEIEAILDGDPREEMLGLLRRSDLPFALTLLTNADENSLRVVLRTRRPGVEEIGQLSLGLSWPSDVYSLSHVALPFPPNDPLYGGLQVDHRAEGLQIGKLALRGERGVLRISAADMLRLRWNPFHSYMEQRLLEFTGL
jgi:alpha-beta hydrolase superfamily lysophospholipase